MKGLMRRTPVVAAAIGVLVAGSIAVGPATADLSLPVVGGVVDAREPSITDDGRWAVFEGTDGERRSVYRTDLLTGTTVELSPVPDGVPEGDTVKPQISADGCVVAAVTQIPFDLFRDDDRDEGWDVYRLVVPECGGQPNSWELVSARGTSGVAGDDAFPDFAPAVAGAGAVIAYTHQMPDADEGLATITVVDLTVPVTEAGRSTSVAGMPVEAPNRAYLYRGATQPAISQNGRHLAFVSDATSSEALPGWGPGPEPGGYATEQVFVWDRFAADQRRAVRLISGRDGTPSTAGASDPSVSEDGRIVVFVSADRTLVPADIPSCTPDCPAQIYRFDRDTDGNGIFDEAPREPWLALVSAVDAGVVDTGLPVAGNAASWAPSVNADGSEIAFVTDATNLLPSRRAGGGGPLDGDLLVAEFELGHIRRVLDGADATGIPGAHGNPDLSRTGGTIVFDTMAGRRLSDGTTFVAAGNRTVAAVAVTPQLSLASLDFGTVLLGFESTELYATVLNAGPAAFEPSVVETDSGNFKVTGGTCTKGIIVAAGASCSVYLTFHPTAGRGYGATLTVSGDGNDAPSVSTTIRGAAGEPTLLADPGGVDFDRAVVGSPGGRVAIDIDNIGFSPTSITRIELGGANPDEFEIITQACTNRALNPDASCAIEIEFQPGAAGYRSALLIVTTSIGQYTSAVVGGFARYEPVFDTSSGELRPGEEFGVGGTGFPVLSPVTIGFDDGSEPFATVTTNEHGNFLAIIDMPVRIRAGERRLVADGGSGAVATWNVKILGGAQDGLPTVPGFGLG